VTSQSENDEVRPTGQTQPISTGKDPGRRSTGGNCSQEGPTTVRNLCEHGGSRALKGIISHIINGSRQPGRKLNFGQRVASRVIRSPLLLQQS
jgi:hypothetical protein